MSTQRADRNYSEILSNRSPEVRKRSRSDHGNLGHFLGPLIVQTDDGQWSIGWHDDAAGPFPSRRFAEQVRLQRTRHDARWLQQ
jgi:hypothetical protein